jgi:hypothetical protein
MSISKVPYSGVPHIYAVVLARHLYFMEEKKSISDEKKVTKGYVVLYGTVGFYIQKMLYEQIAWKTGGVKVHYLSQNRRKVAFPNLLTDGLPGLALTAKPLQNGDTIEFSKDQMSFTLAY